MSIATPVKEESSKDKSDVDLDLDGMMQSEMNQSLEMLRNCAIASVCALIAGSLIDNSIRAMQPLADGEKPTRGDAALYFFVQLCMNIGFIIILNKVSKLFIPWLQTTASGWTFAVLFFVVQDRFAKNTTRITSFEKGA